jgi:acyl carrier protein
LLVDTGLYNIYARRVSEEQELLAGMGRERSLGDANISSTSSTWSSAKVLTKDVRCFLQEKLPEYMVPSSFAILEQMPLTSNGKIDRKVLLASEGLGRNVTEQYAPPVTPAQELLAQLWSEVLQQEQVGIHDNFFELGGHSLLATQLISRVRDVFEVELPLRTLFEQPTIAKLVEAMASLYGGREIIDEIASELQEIEKLSEQEVQQMLETLQAET